MELCSFKGFFPSGFRFLQLQRHSQGQYSRWFNRMKTEKDYTFLSLLNCYTNLDFLAIFTDIFMSAYLSLVTDWQCTVFFRLRLIGSTLNHIPGVKKCHEIKPIFGDPGITKIKVNIVLPLITGQHALKQNIYAITFFFNLQEKKNVQHLKRKKKLLLKDLVVMIARAMKKKRSLKRYFVKIRKLFLNQLDQ